MFKFVLFLAMQDGYVINLIQITLNLSCLLFRGLTVFLVQARSEKIDNLFIIYSPTLKRNDSTNST